MWFHALYCKKKKLEKAFSLRNADLFVTHNTCNNSQIIHLCPPHKHLTRRAAVHLIPQSYIPDLNPGHTFLHPHPLPLFFQPPCCRDPSPALSLTPFVPSTPAYPPNLSGTGFPCPSPGDGWGGRSSPHSPEFTDPISHADTSKS